MALTEKDRKHMRTVIRKYRAAQNSIRNGVVPARGYVFDDGETFTGLPGNRLQANTLTEAEMNTDSVDSRVLKNTGDANAAVGSGHIQTGALTDRHFPFETGVGRRLPGGANLVTVRGENIEGQAVGGSKIDDAIKNPAQGIAGLRTIGSFLGGSSVQSAAGDHSHGSGNSSDFDLIPQAHQDRILLARQRIRNNIGRLDVLTAAQFRLFVRELAIVAVAALNLEVDAPDYTAEQRVERRKAGNPLPLFTEWRVQTETLHDPSMPRYVEGFTDVGTAPQEAPGL